MNNNQGAVLDKQQILQKLTTARKELIIEYPFFGTLVMQLKMSLANVGTAATDMRRILWDPAFVSQISIEEIKFVMMHEVLHCVLKHCLRGKIYNQKLYNIACDIVVNSNILESMNIDEFEVAGEPAMHLAPDGTEGRELTAEEVYKMLCIKHEMEADEKQNGPNMMKPGDGSTDAKSQNSECDDERDDGDDGNIDGEGMIDNHDIWDSISSDDMYLDEQWNNMVQDAAKKASKGFGCGTSLRTLIASYKHKSQVNWKSVLQDFIQVVNETQDFTFSPYDRRFSDSDFMLPAFNDVESEKISNLWFVVDTSGSVCDEALSAVFTEIKAAINQHTSLTGSISFFDSEISDPIEFEENLPDVGLQVKGGGGTSFYSIFKYMEENMEDELPTAVIIMTDGYAQFPPEHKALGVPVLWIIVDSSAKPPWGNVTYVNL